MQSYGKATFAFVVIIVALFAGAAGHYVAILQVDREVKINRKVIEANRQLIDDLKTSFRDWRKELGKTNPDLVVPKEK